MPAATGKRRVGSLGLSTVEPVNAKPRSSGHTTWHEAADGGAKGTFDRPNHRPAVTVRLRDDGILRDHYPIAVDANAIAAILRIPVRIRNGKTIGIRAAGPTATCQAVEPALQWRIGVPAVVAGRRGVN